MASAVTLATAPVATGPQPLTGKALRSCQLATAKICLWEGSVRSSKSVSSLLQMVRLMHHAPPGPFLLTGKTERTTKRNVIDPLIDIFGKRIHYRAGAGEITMFGQNGYVAGGNDETSADRIKGLTLGFAYADEVTTLPESYWTMLLTRLSLPGARVFGTTNPGPPNHWLLKGYLERAKLWLTHDGREVVNNDPSALDLHRFSFRLIDNPYLPADYVAEVERQFVGLWRKRLIEGLWCMAEGAIYDMFDPDRHVVSELPSIIEWVSLGVDYGTTNPTSAILIGLGADGVLYAVAEWRYDSKKSFRQLTDAEYSQQIRAWLAAMGVSPRFVPVDPSAASFRLQLFRDGLRPTAADNEVGDGIRLVSSLLATDHLKIHKSCTGLIEELPSYTWDDRASVKGIDQPVKANDHSCDALRYALKTTQAIWQYQLR